MDIGGGGICGLSLALNLHQRGLKCLVYERAPELTELGVGIALLPHALREFAALGIADEPLAAGIENRWRSCGAVRTADSLPGGTANEDRRVHSFLSKTIF